LIVADDIITLEDRISKAEREYVKLYIQELINVVRDSCKIVFTGTPWHKDDAFSIMPNIQRYDCYSTGLINATMLQTIRDSMTSSLFAANYELKHIADKDAMFTNCTIEDGTNTEKI
jgi:hypothetical protein